MPRLAGKIALISGGARGMGAGHAKAFVAEGAKVVIGDLLDDEGSRLADELGPDVVFTHLDVTSQSDWKDAVDLTVSTFGGLNVLVNNAGIVNFGPIGTYTLDQWNLIMNVNVTSQFLGITAARDALVSSAPSSIVNISSLEGLRGVAGSHGYSASKWAIRGLTKSVALELGALNVRANSVHPGIVRTPMADGIDLSSLYGALNRIGEPEEVAALVLFLASDESSYSTGAEFVIDAGLSAGEAPSAE